jgi:hypothetical protein
MGSALTQKLGSTGTATAATNVASNSTVRFSGLETTAGHHETESGNSNNNSGGPTATGGGISNGHSSQGKIHNIYC